MNNKDEIYEKIEILNSKKSELFKNKKVKIEKINNEFEKEISKIEKKLKTLWDIASDLEYNLNFDFEVYENYKMIKEEKNEK